MTPSFINRRQAYGVGLLLIGGVLGYILAFSQGKSTAPYNEMRSHSATSSFTNPLLLCDQGEELLSSKKSQPLKISIEALIEEEKAKGNVEYVSVYYRDLNNGPWIGINEKEKFYPSSLMKVPVLLYFYKKSETDSSLLARKLKATATSTYIQYFQPSQKVESGKLYTTGELVQRMIRYSDNNASDLLVSRMEKGALGAILTDLYIDLPTDKTSDYLRVKDYATFFRVLFNASYLNKENSEKALKLLSESEFDQGLKKYLPQETVVAHKFGEHQIPETGQSQVHDCGIVYYPNQPYVLCVMTRGREMDKMTNTIGLISKLVYASIQNSR